MIQSIMVYFYDGNGSLELIGFCDANWARDPINKQSMNKYIFILGNGPISWNNVKQKAIAESNVEAKYYVAGEATILAIWIRHILDEMGFSQRNLTKIFCDRQSNIVMIKISNNLWENKAY